MVRNDNTILVVGANPALQKTLFFKNLSLDDVNRATSLRCYTGGKGTNFCRALQHYGVAADPLTTTLYTFVGGVTGSQVTRLLIEEGIHTCLIDVPSETRTCITCLDDANQTMTELIEPSFPVPPTSADAMAMALTASIGNAAGLAITGSLPDGSDSSLYTHWTEIATKAKKPVLIDAVKGIIPSLKVPDSKILLKINKSELFGITGKRTIEESFAFAMREWAIALLAVTDGPSTAYLQVRGQPLYAFAIPKLDAIVSPLGSGDTADAVFFIEYLKGTDTVTAFRRALAAASANCLEADAGVFSPTRMQMIETGIFISLLVP